MLSFVLRDRITKAESGSISRSLFEFLYFDSGAAIQITSSGFSLKIDSSFFRFCVSQSHGGAIFLQGMNTIVNRTCFDTCFRFGTSDNCYGNAIFSELYGSSTKTSLLELTSFFGCGPSESAGDSTVYYGSHPLESHDLNFSQCCGYGGSTSITGYAKAIKSKFLSTYGGKSWVIADVQSGASMNLQKMNSLNFTQTTNLHLLFAGNNFVITDCCLFVWKRYGDIGSVTFKGSCYSNIKFTGLKETKTTEIWVPEIKADGYCQLQNVRMNDLTNGLNPKLLNIPLLQLLYQLRNRTY